MCLYHLYPTRSLNGQETIRLNAYLFTIYLQLSTHLNNASSYITVPQTTVLHTELFPNYFCPNNYNTTTETTAKYRPYIAHRTAR